MKKGLLFILVGLLVTLVACNTEKESKNVDTPELIPIAVDLKIDPEKINPGEEVTLHAYVTQGEESVEDADEVQFEIEQKGNDDSEFIDGEHAADGEYTATTTFHEDGVYFVTAHVTARSMHTMPKVELTIGNPNLTTSPIDETKKEEHQHGSDHHHGEGHVSINFPLENEYTKGKETTLQVSFAESGEPLTEARVRFEVWKEEAEKHEFIDANETGNGTYQAAYTFADTGTYHIQVHIEKDDIHEHLEKTTTIK
ncbi:FixH family protein [Ferdinandcohnia sp. Marseille-Q9671]